MTPKYYQINQSKNRDQGNVSAPKAQQKRLASTTKNKVTKM